MFSNMKLGRIAPTAEQKARAPHLRKYLTKPLPPAPPSFSGSQGASIGLWGNDKFGDCTFAALANGRAIAAQREGRPMPPTTEYDVIKAYSDFTGGQDVGAVEVEVLDAAKRGVNLGGPEPWIVAAWVSVDIHDLPTCKSLLSIFWYLYLGLDMPTAAKSQSVWDVGPDMTGDFQPGSWGGHAALWSDYDASGAGIVTWGEVKRATYPWIAGYTEEAHLLLDAERAAVAGVDWDALCNDLNSVSI